MSKTYSRSGLQLTEHFEGCKLIGYLDVKGIPTNGFGHTGPDVYESQVITQEQANAWLLQDVQNAVNHVNSLVSVPLTQDEFNALIDFAFNCGCEAFAGSTMLRLLNAGDYKNSALEFTKWDKAGGRIVAGLLRRRISEEEEFNGQA